MKLLQIASILLYYLGFLINSAMVTSAQTYTYTIPGEKRKCYQCNMPYQCSSGVCYGDVCVKSLANGRYVSKGCENKTSRAMVGMPPNVAGPDPKSICSSEVIFSVETEICYCTDMDFCNQAPHISNNNLHLFSWLLSFTVILFRYYIVIL